MTKDEYKEKMKAADDEYAKARRQIMKEYAFSNSAVNIGDIVTDHIGSIRVENIQFCKNYDTPECVYTGTELKKDRTPKAKEPKREVFQSNLVN